MLLPETLSQLKDGDFGCNNRGQDSHRSWLKKLRTEFSHENIDHVLPIVKKSQRRFCTHKLIIRQQLHRRRAAIPIVLNTASKCVATIVHPGTSLPIKSGVEGRRRIICTFIHLVKSTESGGNARCFRQLDGNGSVTKAV